MTEQREKILDRISKLMNLGSSSNPNEAMAAMEKANQLMMKHNIKRAELRDYHSKWNMTHKQVPMRRFGVKEVKNWHITVVDSMARLFDMKCFFQKAAHASRTRVFIVGPADNVDGAIASIEGLFAWLHKRILDDLEEYKC